MVKNIETVVFNPLSKDTHGLYITGSSNRSKERNLLSGVWKETCYQESIPPPEHFLDYCSQMRSGISRFKKHLFEMNSKACRMLLQRRKDDICLTQLPLLNEKKRPLSASAKVSGKIPSIVHTEILKPKET